jgi:serine/threonine protein kinase
MTPLCDQYFLKPDYWLYWYAIKDVLGQGGSGLTYRAYDANLSRVVAIKEFLPAGITVRDPDGSVHASGSAQTLYRDGLDSFLSEARSLAKFNHPAIARVYSVFEANNTAYRVMHYLEGETLKQLVERTHTLNEAQIRHLLLPILDGLALVHASGFIHRDIKPTNIFIRSDGSPCLLDFGSAKPLCKLQHETANTGALEFAPFEQCAETANCHGPWTDIYSLAATLYWACTGHQPVHALQRAETIQRGDADPLVPLHVLANGRYSSEFLRAIDHALAFDRCERPQDVEAWRVEFGNPSSVLSQMDGDDASGVFEDMLISSGDTNGKEAIGETKASWSHVRAEKPRKRRSTRERPPLLRPWLHANTPSVAQDAGVSFTPSHGSRLSALRLGLHRSSQSFRRKAKRVWRSRARISQWAIAGLLCAILSAANYDNARSLEDPAQTAAMSLLSQTTEHKAQLLARHLRIESVPDRRIISNVFGEKQHVSKAEALALADGRSLSSLASWSSPSRQSSYGMKSLEFALIDLGDLNPYVSTNPRISSTDAADDRINSSAQESAQTNNNRQSNAHTTLTQRVIARDDRSRTSKTHESRQAFRVVTNGPGSMRSEYRIPPVREYASLQGRQNDSARFVRPAHTAPVVPTTVARPFANYTTKTASPVGRIAAPLRSAGVARFASIDRPERPERPERQIRP